MKLDLKKYRNVGITGKVEMIAPKNHEGIFQCYWKITLPKSLLVLKVMKSNNNKINFKILKMVKTR